MLVFDVSRKDSFESIPKWITDVYELKKDDALYILIGNKTDITERVVTKEEAQKVADEYKIHYFELSAKTGDGFQEFFENKLITLINEKFTPEALDAKAEKIGVKLQEEKMENETKDKDNKKKKCC